MESLDVDDDPVDWKSFHHRTREYVVRNILLKFSLLLMFMWFVFAVFCFIYHFQFMCYDYAL